MTAITAETDEPPQDDDADKPRHSGETLIVFHDAVRAADVLALIRTGSVKDKSE
ncbi:MAG: hypothetical protein HC841_08650 [Verrucomicrobiae bacterium]|nr:hypothetical protein [Verrucomicrobiae bacterium]